MELLRFLPPLLRAAGSEVRSVGRELLGTVVGSETAPLYPPTPAWVHELAAALGPPHVSPALLEALAGELTGWDPAGRAHRIGLMGIPATAVNGTRATMVASLEELERGDRTAAHRVAENVRVAVELLRSQGARLELHQVLEYYTGLGREAADPSGQELARRVWARYAWTVLASLPRERAADLLPAFAPTTEETS